MSLAGFNRARREAAQKAKASRPAPQPPPQTEPEPVSDVVERPGDTAPKKKASKRHLTESKE